MDKTLLIIALIPAPLAAFLVWVVVCELRGVPAFKDGQPPKAGQLDSIGRWVLGVVYFGLAAVAYGLGGAVEAALWFGVIAVVATVITVFRTVGEGAWQRLRRGKNAEQDAPVHCPMPVRRRLGLNFRRTIIWLPLFLVSYG